MSSELGREDERALDVLRGLGGAPATPFFEGRVARLVLGYLREMGAEHWRDEYGNIVARYRRGDAAGRAAVAFVAHMDHPGFEVVEVDGLRAVAVAQGGVPAASLTKPTAVLVVTPEGERVPAVDGAGGQMGLRSGGWGSSWRRLSARSRRCRWCSTCRTSSWRAA